MATNTGKDHRKEAVSVQTQVENPKTGNFVRRNRDSDSEHEGELMDVRRCRRDG